MKSKTIALLTTAAIALTLLPLSACKKDPAPPDPTPTENSGDSSVTAPPGDSTSGSDTTAATTSGNGSTESGSPSLTTAVSTDPPPVIPPVNERGNTSGNINNAGIAAAQGDWIYYINMNDGISRMRLDGTGDSVVANVFARELNVQGDWIYYTNLLQLIFRVRTDGTGEPERVGLRDDFAYFVNVVGDWIYFVNGSDNYNIYKIKTDGTGRAKITSAPARYITVQNDWVYYANDDDWFVYRIRPDGTNVERLLAYEVDLLTVEGDFLFYIDEEADMPRLRRTPIESTTRILVAGDTPLTMNVYNGWIYYTNEDDGGSIYKIRTNGDDRRKLNDIESDFINVIGDWIFFYGYFDDGSDTETAYGVLYRMRTDGSGLQTVL